MNRWGVGKKKRTQKASILVEDDRGTQARVRLNLLEAESKSRGLFGTAFSDGKMVKVAEPYSAFFTALDAEVARRSAQAVNTAVLAPAASEPATALAPAVAPAPAGAPVPAATPAVATPSRN